MSLNALSSQVWSGFASDLKPASSRFKASDTSPPSSASSASATTPSTATAATFSPLGSTLPLPSPTQSSLFEGSSNTTSAATLGLPLPSTGSILAEIYEGNPRPNHQHLHPRSTSFSASATQQVPNSYFAKTPSLVRSRSQSSAPAPPQVFISSSTSSAMNHGNNGGSMDPSSSHPIRIAASNSTKPEDYSMSFQTSSSLGGARKGGEQHNGWASSLEDHYVYREGRSRIRDDERPWAELDEQSSTNSHANQHHVGIGLSNMSPFSRDGSRALVDDGTGGYRARRDYSLGAVGTGRKRGDTVWARPLREAEDEDAEDAFAPPTRSGATSRRHSVSGFSSAATSRSQVGFALPDDGYVGQGTSSHGMNGSGNRGGLPSNRMRGFSAIDDDDLAADLNSLHLDLEAHAAATSSSPPHRSALSLIGSMPIYPAGRRYSSRNYDDDDSSRSPPPIGTRPQLAGPISGSPYSPGGTTKLRLFPAPSTSLTGGETTRNASRFEFGAAAAGPEVGRPALQPVGSGAAMLPNMNGSAALGMMGFDGGNRFTPSSTFAAAAPPPPLTSSFFPPSLSAQAQSFQSPYQQQQYLQQQQHTLRMQQQQQHQQPQYRDHYQPPPPSMQQQQQHQHQQQQQYLYQQHQHLPPQSSFYVTPTPLVPSSTAASSDLVELTNLGRGIPLHAVPANAPLYIVEFKAGRKDLFFVEDPSLQLRQGDLVIVEADRGQDIGKFFKPCSLDEVQAFQQRLVELALGQLANPTGGAGVGGGGGAPQPPSTSAIARITKEFAPKKIFKKAELADTQLLLSKAQDEVKALAFVRNKVAQKNLAMEITDAEWQWDRRKLTFFYLADQRVDFRELVRELFRLYKTRIWMCCLEQQQSAWNFNGDD